MGRRDRRGDETTEYRRRYSGPVEFRHAAPKRGKRKLRSPLWTKFCLVFGVLFILTSAMGIGAKVLLTSRYDNNIKRENLLGEHRTDKKVKLDGPLNFLILGLDKRSEEDYDPNDDSSHTWVTDGSPARADTIMWVHVPKGANKAYVVSIPRDTYVYIPENNDENAEIQWEGGEDRINAAYAYGGAPLMISTLKELTGITIDFPILVNFKAVKEITDAVGGVDVTVDELTQDYRTLEIFKPGPQRLDGKRADAYVRQRKAICMYNYPVKDPRYKGEECGLPRGDYDRQARQQQFIQALSHRIDEQGMATNPKKLDKLLRVITDNLTVDESMPVQDLVFSLKHLSQKDLTFLSLPMGESITLDNGALVETVNEPQTEELFSSIQNGTMEQYIAQYGKNDVTHGA